MLYALGAAAALGFLLPDTLSVWAPGVSALAVVDAALLAAIGMLTVGRVLFQEVPTRGAEAFLLLPVPRQRVASAVLARSAASALNAVPLAFAIPFALRTVRAADGPAGAAGFVAGVAALVAVSHLAVVVWKTRLGEAPARTVALVAATVAAVLALDLAAGGLSAGLHGATGAALVAALGLVAVGLGVVAYRGIVGALYLDAAARRRRTWMRASGPTGFAHAGVRAFVALDARLLTRARYPRGIALNATVLGVALTLAALLGSDGGEPATLLLLFATGSVTVSLSQFAIPFTSGYYDRLLTLPGAVPAFVRAKLALGVGAAGLLGLVQAALAVGLAPSALPAVGVGVLFAAGVLAPVAVLGSSLAPKPLDVDDRVMLNYKVQSLAAQAAVGAAGAVAVGLFVALGPEAGLAAVAAVGAAGTLALPLWVRAIAHRMERRRHAVAVRFRATL